MYKNADIQTVVVDFSRRREQELSISKTFVRLNVLNYKKLRYGDQSVSSNSNSLLQVACEQRVAVVNIITNSCVKQAVIVISSVVSVKCKQRHKSSEKNKEFY